MAAFRIPLFRVATDIHLPHRRPDRGTENRVNPLDECS
jgi:hypothetical protein